MSDVGMPVPIGGRLLSNGRYSTFITAAGTGQSRREGLVVNRWPGDLVEDGHGQFLYLRDRASGTFWSVGRQPVLCESRSYRAAATDGVLRIEHETEGIGATLEVAVCPEQDFEVRRLTLRNAANRRRQIEVTSYFEAVLNWQAADLGHPAFSKLFLQTEIVREQSMLLVHRRPRANGEHWPTLFHALSGASLSEWETDRLRFLGRGRTAAAPVGLSSSLSGTVGNVLDPCCSLRAVLDIPAGGEVTVSLLTGIAEVPDEARSWAERYRDPEALGGVFAAAEAAERSLRTELEISSQQAERIQNLAAAMIAGDRRLVPAAGSLSADVDANAVLGGLGILRDRPLIVAERGWRSRGTGEVRVAREYLSRHGFLTNLLVLDDASESPPPGLDDRVRMRGASQLSAAERGLLNATAVLVVGDGLPAAECDWSPAAPPRVSVLEADPAAPAEEPLEFWNGYGGFSADGREYVISIPGDGDRRRPPLPWINVIANPSAGFLVTESGAGCMWARNSQANRLTPWSNEPVSDPHGEAFYLRDEETGAVFSPMPGPIESTAAYRVRHGFGYSVFESTVGGIEQKATLFVPKDDPVKIVLLKLINRGATARRLSLTVFQQLVMGSGASRPSLIATRRGADGSLRGVNHAAGDFAGGIAFSLLSVEGSGGGGVEFTCDRASFLGRFGSPGKPAGLQSGRALDGRTGHGLDACFAQRQELRIEPGEEVECVALLGEAMSEAAADGLVEKYRRTDGARRALEEVTSFWRDLLGRVQVRSASRKLDIMVNGWLPYQTLCCRMWARSGYSQSSGGFGFRDQLQDAGNLLALEPRLTREQILLHARQQFVEGDVLHWWHPEPIGRGLRTTFSDDLLWLSLVTADYVRGTGDAGILEEKVPFLTGPVLKEGEDEAYITPEPSGQEGTVYEHCCRAIDRSLRTGSHGLPLMGCGDWNDGMNRVGREGRGESVWMGFFLFKILGEFIAFGQGRNDADRVARYTAHRERLEVALNADGWDGEWYRRAYYDNGEPLGSRENEECRIDALAQSWAILSGAAPVDRARMCMEAMSRELISMSDGIIRLLAPPFVDTPNDPGYIKGYVAGIRENGGQYTHAACWAVMALAMQRERSRALRLWEMLSPISHAETRQAAEHYMGEPYSLPGDVYGASPHVGRCGWTWYTGSSGWLYRVGLESILGVRIENGTTVVVSPCIPDEWPGYEVVLRGAGRHGGCIVRVENPGRVAEAIVSAESDGMAVPASGTVVRVPLIAGAESREQRIRVVLGRRGGGEG